MYSVQCTHNDDDKYMCDSDDDNYNDRNFNTQQFDKIIINRKRQANIAYCVVCVYCTKKTLTVQFVFRSIFIVQNNDELITFNKIEIEIS